MLVFDAHLDLAMNAMEWNRDLRLPLEDIRAREQGMADKPDRGRGTVCFPEMHKGQVGLCVATLIARYVKPSNPLPGWHSPPQAWAQTQGQLAWYQEMERQGYLRQITTAKALDQHVADWENTGPGNVPIGYVLSLEGADSIINPELLQRSWDQGLRLLGPAHYGPGTYAMGTHTEGGFTEKGRSLLRAMERLGMVLDVTHLSDACFFEAVERYDGPIWASHSNARALVPDQRQFSDQQLRLLIGRGAVIGAAMDAWMLVPGWVRGTSTPENTPVTLRDVARHIDHICQLAGNSRHSCLGTDLDGGFGREQSPSDLNSIADLVTMREILGSMGYKAEDQQHILRDNGLGFLRKALPQD